MSTSSELTNLLPEARKRKFRRRYFLRLATVLLILLSLLTLLHGVLLLPTYLYAYNEVTRSKAELALRQASEDAAGEIELTARQAKLVAISADLGQLASTPAASTLLRNLLVVPRPGIALTGFTFTAPSGTGTVARMQVTGVAGSRDALRQYARALGQLPFVTSADLPISAYAKETNINFTITLSGTLQP